MTPSRLLPARRRRVPSALLILLAGLVAAAALAEDAPFPEPAVPWLGMDTEIVDFLREAELVSKERLGSGITRPYRLVLERNGVRRRAIWKPLQRRSFEGGLESYHSEIAAYRLSRHLGLDMVPPTVERRLGNRYGSLQLWVEGYRPFSQVDAVRPPSSQSWALRMARMAFFDTLIDNPDRHQKNFLVGDHWQVVLIDHSRSLNFGHRGPLRTAAPPTRYDAELVERARELDLATLRSLLGDLLGGSELRTLLHRRDQLLSQVAEVAALRGERIAFYPED